MECRQEIRMAWMKRWKKIQKKSKEDRGIPKTKLTGHAKAYVRRQGKFLGEGEKSKKYPRFVREW